MNNEFFLIPLTNDNFEYVSSLPIETFKSIKLPDVVKEPTKITEPDIDNEPPKIYTEYATVLAFMYNAYKTLSLSSLTSAKGYTLQLYRISDFR